MNLEQTLAAAFNTQISRVVTGPNVSYVPERSLEASVFDAVIQAGGPVQWQDPASPSCGNNDGCVYIVVTTEAGTDDEEDHLLAFDIADNCFYR